MGAMELFDRVRLVTARDDLEAGAIGTIVEVFERPERAYEVELTKVRDNLQVLEDHYRRTEGDNVALWGRL